MRLFTSLAIVSMLFGLIGITPIQVQAAEAGDLVTCSDYNSVYYLANDDTRWVFPNEATYFTWYEDFDDVVEISCEELSLYSIGSVVTYQPGTRLVKIQSINKVYAVEPGGVLRWIGSESQANDLYSSDWAGRIDDVPDGFWSSYTEGNALALGEYPIGTIISNADVSIYGQHYHAFYRIDPQDLFERVYEVFLNPVLNSYVIELSDDQVEPYVDVERKALSEVQFDELVTIDAEVFVEELTEEEEQELGAVDTEDECNGSDFYCFTQAAGNCESVSLLHDFTSEMNTYNYTDTMYMSTEPNQGGGCVFHIEFVSAEVEMMDEYYDYVLNDLFAGDVDLLNQGVQTAADTHTNIWSMYSLDFDIDSDVLWQLPGTLTTWDADELDFNLLDAYSDYVVVDKVYSP
jgi:hypothetical protein